MSWYISQEYEVAMTVVESWISHYSLDSMVGPSTFHCLDEVLLIQEIFFILKCACLGASLNTLKLLSAIFYQIFIFHQMIALQKLWKMFFISSRKLFSFLTYSNFCIFVFPSFFLSAIVLDVDPRKILKFMMSSTVQIRT